MGKPKHKQRLLPVALPSTTAVDLFLLAGLPNPLNQRVEEFFQTLAGTNAKVISSPSPSYDGPLYKQRTVDTLLTAGATFAIRRLKNRSDDQYARPRRIALFYVPADDDQLLLAAFDFFVFPVPLRDLAKFDEAGHQVRHQRTACEAAIRKDLRPVSGFNLSVSCKSRNRCYDACEGIVLAYFSTQLPARYYVRAGRPAGQGDRQRRHWPGVHRGWAELVRVDSAHVREP